MKCCQDESGFLLYCLAGESTWNVPKLFSLKALIELQARIKGCTVSPPHPSLPCIHLSEAAPCTAGLAQVYQQGGLNWAGSWAWAGSRKPPVISVLCQQWKPSNKTSKPLPDNPWGQQLTSSFSEWHNIGINSLLSSLTILSQVPDKMTFSQVV